ncbi:MAG: prepilin peptidase [Chitinispirillaceae bacterium]
MIEPTTYFLPALVLIFGLMIGSFFNVLIYRLPRNESVVWPGSHCPDCRNRLKLWHNIPVISYLFLRGACAFCRKKVSLRYPVVEIVTALLALWLWFSLGTQSMTGVSWWRDLYTIARMLSLLILLPVSLIDLRHYIIPDAITIGGLIAGLALSFIPGDLTPLQAVLGMAAGGGSLYCVGLFGEYVLRKEDSMGGGDIKLMAFLGAFWGWQTVLMGIVFASFMGALVGVGMIILGALKKDRHIPFGPFLAAGCWTAVLYGDYLLRSYIAFIDAGLTGY